jgi:hypothetical protein
VKQLIHVHVRCTVLRLYSSRSLCMWMCGIREFQEYGCTQVAVQYACRIPILRTATQQHAQQLKNERKLLGTRQGSTL